MHVVPFFLQVLVAFADDGLFRPAVVKGKPLGHRPADDRELDVLDAIYARRVGGE